MKFDLIKNGRVLAHFSGYEISINELVWLHRQGYQFKLSDSQPSDMMLLANQAG